MHRVPRVDLTLSPDGRCSFEGSATSHRIPCAVNARGDVRHHRAGGVFVWDSSEGATILASYARANDWGGADRGDPLLAVAMVSSRVPTHQSAVVGASLWSRFVSALRLDATDPLSETVAALNGFQPRPLVGYSSVLRPLAAEQRAGRVRIAPQAGMSASEVLTEHAATEMHSVWGSVPFDV